MMFEREKIPKGIELFKVTDPFSFGALHRYWTTIRTMGKPHKGIIIVLTRVHFFDQSNFYLFKGFCERCYRKKVKIILVNTQTQPLGLIKKEGLYDSIGPQNIVDTILQALKCFGNIS